MKSNKRSAGRPKYEPIMPKGKFTINDFCESNGVNIKSGKGDKCSKLTLIKFLARDHKRGGKSVIVKLADVVAEPNSKAGLGRKAYVYQLRTKVAAPAPKVTPKAKVKSPRKAKPTGVTAAVAQYESVKNDILAPVADVASDPVESTPAEPVTAPAPEVPAPAESVPTPEVPVAA
jgi:hypothetical protein